MPIYYEVTGSKIKKAAYDLRACQPVFVSKSSILIRIPESEKSFIQKVTTDLSLSLRPYGDELPPNRKMACGKVYVEGRNTSMHIGQCKVCRVAMGKSVTKPAVTVVKVKGLTEMSINGLLSAMKLRYEECMDLAGEWDRAIKALEGLTTLQERTKALEVEKVEHTKAIKLFLKEV